MIHPLTTCKHQIDMDRTKRSVKQQIKESRHFLSRDDLPETVRQTKERVLDLLLDETKERDKSNKEKKINKRYKMVKFFERRKVTRRLKSLLRQFKMNTLDITERELLIKEIQQARADLNYIIHYPVGEKYLALYPTTATSDKSLQRRAILYQRILVKIKKGNVEDAIFSCFDHDSLGLLPSLETGLLPQGGDVNLEDIKQEEEREEKERCEAEEDTQTAKQDREEDTEAQEVIEYDKGFQSNSTEEDVIRVKNGKTRNCRAPVKKAQKKKKRNEEIKSKELASNPLQLSDDDGANDSLFLKRRRKVTAACDEEGESSLPKKIKNDPFFLL